MTDDEINVEKIRIQKSKKSALVQLLSQKSSPFSVFQLTVKLHHNYWDGCKMQYNSGKQGKHNNMLKRTFKDLHWRQHNSKSTLGSLRSPPPFLILPELCRCHWLPPAVHFVQDDTSTHTPGSLHSLPAKYQQWGRDLRRQSSRPGGADEAEDGQRSKRQQGCLSVLQGGPKAEWTGFLKMTSSRTGVCINQRRPEWEDSGDAADNVLLSAASSTVTMLALRRWWSGDAWMAAQTSRS